MNPETVSKMNETADIDRIVFREVTATTWPDFERLVECRGGPKACWCMVWRASTEEARRTDGASRKAAMRQRIAAGTTVGLLGYLDEEPVAWCSVAPRSSYRRLLPDAGAGADAVVDAVVDTGSDEGVWSIACFFVVRRLRGLGLSQRILASAVAFATSRGARLVEAYPVAPDSPSYRFMGFVPLFQQAGFSEA
ncbi:MAG: GNAT family N-acetyltransferase, partial [Rhodoferax sp.]|nr:GNAT family N-acetyltransferase [Rhodoferax sp.]